MPKFKSLPLREAWRLAAPMILCNMTVPLLGIVDIAVVGHLNDAYYMGAVSIGAMIFNFLYWAFGFLRMGTTGLIAQAYGRQDFVAVRIIFARAMVMALVIALGLLVLQWPIAKLAFWLIKPPNHVLQFAQMYFHIRIWAAPATMINYAIMGWFIGMHNTRVPLLLMVITNVIGMVFDLIFVLGFHWNVAGVAWATVIAQYCQLLFGVWLALRVLNRNPVTWQWRDSLKLEGFKAMAKINSDIFIRTLCLLFTFAFFTTQSARMGTIVLAANSILLNLQSLMAYALDGFANAAEALVGRAVGKDDKQALAHAVLAAGIWSGVIAVAYSLVYGVAGKGIIHLVTGIEAVRQYAMTFLPWMIISPLVSVWSFLFDGVFVGATRSREMRNTMVFATVIIYLPLWYVTQSFGNYGLWFAFLTFMAARGITMGWCYYKKL